MPKQNGGGNNPSCGCDMQAGWPPASEFPRGGLQGGGMNNLKSANFQFSLTNKSGKQHKYKGRINTNNSMNVSANTANANLNNNNMKKKKTQKNNKNRRATSAPPGMRKLAYKGNSYLEETATGKTYTMTANGSKGNFVGTYVRPNSGEPYMETPPAAESQAMEVNGNNNENNENMRGTNNNENNENNENMRSTNNNENNENNESMRGNSNNEYDDENPPEEKNKRLSMEGGRRRRGTRKRGKKHGKRCPCFLCMFKKLKFTAKRR